MNRDKVLEYMQKGFNCSQTVLLYFADRVGIDESTAKRISKTFESGMFKGEICGAVSGAYMVLGLAFSDDSENNRAILKEKVDGFTNSFKEKMGSNKCEDLLGINISTDENLMKAFREKKIEEVCPKAVFTTVEILEDILKEK